MQITNNARLFFSPDNAPAVLYFLTDIAIPLNLDPFSSNFQCSANLNSCDKRMLVLLFRRDHDLFKQYKSEHNKNFKSVLSLALDGLGRALPTSSSDSQIQHGLVSAYVRFIDELYVHRKCHQLIRAVVQSWLLSEKLYFVYRHDEAFKAELQKLEFFDLYNPYLQELQL